MCWESMVYSAKPGLPRRTECTRSAEYAVPLAGRARKNKSVLRGSSSTDESKFESQAQSSSSSSRASKKYVINKIKDPHSLNTAQNGQSNLPSIKFTVNQLATWLLS
mmetsp:Transcript_21187/g.46097  ORF Transcript_21187/g.46097 Transcript_21187/m.46097 type:complete len:107 (-) Transcript_21187:8-328(-)